MTVFAVIDGVGRLRMLFESPVDAWNWVLSDQDNDLDLHVEGWPVQGGDAASRRDMGHGDPS